ncbi:hypothetical protein MAP00_006672 [Monascus purpureus]|nr:hypothetical protein MAP00_006672 [Monascus purpureus]
MVFRFPKVFDPITLFHNPKLAPSTRVLTLLKQASVTASETATEDQASDYSSQIAKQRGEFDLQISTAPPTTDQLRSILEFISPGGVGGTTPIAAAGGNVKRLVYKPSDLVVGAKDAEDAIRRFKEDQSRFVRPVTVDWTGGRAIIGDNESEILNMVRLAWPAE